MNYLLCLAFHLYQSCSNNKTFTHIYAHGVAFRLTLILDFNFVRIIIYQVRCLVFWCKFEETLDIE